MKQKTLAFHILKETLQLIFRKNNEIKIFYRNFIQFSCKILSMTLPKIVNKSGLTVKICCF
jgi:hypothetical protein